MTHRNHCEFDRKRLQQAQDWCTDCCRKFRAAIEHDFFYTNKEGMRVLEHIIHDLNKWGSSQEELLNQDFYHLSDCVREAMEMGAVGPRHDAASEMMGEFQYGLEQTMSQVSAISFGYPPVALVNPVADLEAVA